MAELYPELSIRGGLADITIRVRRHEQVRIRRVEIVGPDGPLESQVSQLAGLTPGDLLKPSRIRAGVARLRATHPDLCVEAQESLTRRETPPGERKLDRLTRLEPPHDTWGAVVRFRLYRPPADAACVEK